MSDAELAKAKGGAVLHIPTVLGAVVIIYNLPGLTQPLKLTGDALAAIFQGQITRWNDARIASQNPGVALPATDILVVHRSDGSGTSYVFTDYLSAVSPAWATKPGRGKEVQWPVGLGAKGNEGVAGQVKQTPGAIGYTELAYATQNHLATAAIRNAAGEFTGPSIASATAAAAGAVSTLPSGTDYRVSIVNAPGQGVYPISSFTWIIVYQKQSDAAKGKKLVDFLHWALAEGQAMASPLDYAPLPASMRAGLATRLGTIQIPQ
jgi:phosphate transport system substrate-binding protein